MKCLTSFPLQNHLAILHVLRQYDWEIHLHIKVYCFLLCLALYSLTSSMGWQKIQGRELHIYDIAEHLKAEVSA